MQTIDVKAVSVGTIHDHSVCFDQAEEVAAWEKAKEEEKKKLQRERAVLSKQSCAMLKLPTKKNRAEVGPPNLTSNIPLHLPWLSELITKRQ